MAPLFEHYGVQLCMPETGRQVDYASEHDEKTMIVLGLSSKGGGLAMTAVPRTWTHEHCPARARASRTT